MLCARALLLNRTNEQKHSFLWTCVFTSWTPEGSIITRPLCANKCNKTSHKTTMKKLLAQGICENLISRITTPS